MADLNPREQEGLGAIRPAGIRGVRTEPVPRPLLAALIRGLLRATGKLPLRRIQNLGAGVGRLLWWLPTRPRRNTLENLRSAFPDLPERERRARARRSLIEDGKMMAEHAALWTWPRERVEPLIQVVEGGDRVREAMDSGRSVIVAATHLGAVEALNIACTTRWSMASQYRAPRIRELDPLFRHARERFGATLLPASKASVRMLLRGLKEGRMLGIPCDQDAGEGQGIFVPFFGRLANTMTLIPRLANRSNALVIVGYGARLPRGGGFEVHFVPAPEAVYGDDLLEAATALNRTVEDCVRRIPDQYLWSYARFRIRPPRPSAADPQRGARGEA